MGIPVPSSQFWYEPKTDLKKNNSALKRWKRGSLQRTSFTSNTKLCFFHPRLAFMFKSSRLAISPCLEKLTPSPLIPCSSLNPWPQTKSGHRSPRRGQNPWRRLKCLSPKQIWENECEDASVKDRIRWLCRPATISKQKRYLKIWKQLCSAGGWGWGMRLGDSQTKSGDADFAGVGQAEEIISSTHEGTKRSATIWWKPHSQQKEEGKLRSMKGLGHGERLSRHI